MVERRSELHDAARRYARQGIPVFPLASGTKVPLIAAQHGGRGLHDATTNAARIDAWWRACPDCNIALRTGTSWAAARRGGQDPNVQVRADACWRCGGSGYLPSRPPADGIRFDVVDLD